MTINEKTRRAALKFLGSIDHKIKTKFTNICDKTGQYDVPDELFQKRTSRKNRVLLPWKTVKANHLTIEQLNSFYGGVVVEFVNEDYFLPENQKDTVFQELKNRIGGDDNVASIISIRSESGSSSSQLQRDCFARLIDKTEIIYRGSKVIVTKDNFMDYKLKRPGKGGRGNEKWSGFLYVSIRGGQQDTIQTHEGKKLCVFNPASEYASPEICDDLDLTMAYFALISINRESLLPKEQELYDEHYGTIIANVKQALADSEYNHSAYKGNLLDYCNNHPSVKMIQGQLTDPIQVERIDIMDFAIDKKEDPRNLDFTHDEAVNLGRFYWDSVKQTILSPARPTNVFWSKHLSNMMQQNYSLEGYFAHEEEIFERRKRLLNRS